MGWGPKAPDMSGANEAAREGAAIAREQWNDYKTLFAPRIMEQMDQQIQIGRDTYELAREQQDFQLGLAERFNDRYWNTQVPLEDQIISEARNFDTDAERERLAGQARGDVAQAFGAQRAGLRRDMGRAGLNPSDPRYFSMMKGMATDEALATAYAANKTREAAKQLGWSRRVDASALARGLPGFSGGSTSAAMGWGGQGMQGAGMGLNASLGGLGGLNQTAGSSAGTFNNVSSNLRQNAVAGAQNPGFDAVMGLAAGGLKLAGSTYGGAGWTF